MLREHEIYFLEVYKPLLYAMPAVFNGKLRECSVFESSQFGSVLREKITNYINLEETDDNKELGVAEEL